MFGYRSGSVSTNVGTEGTAGTHRVLGVLWTPAVPKERRLPPKVLVPGNRRTGTHRRPRHIGQHTAAPGARAFAAEFMALATACP